MEYECVIGLEVHVQLQTQTKMFCSCPNKFTHEPNTNVCPVCLGQPGSLPVINKLAFELGIKGGLALNCEIPEYTKFDRKHYYYPDLPKNIQISQFDMPVCVNGHLNVTADGKTERIGVTRAHLEEDAGKLIHSTSVSNVDLNRTGTPLLEIVSEPDLRSPQQAKAYLEMIKLAMQYAQTSDCNMEEGSLRCDANISIRPVGETKLGVKNEIKNMNSFKGVEHALELVMAELLRQKEAGEEIKQVTWGYNLDKQKVFKMRVKENDNDYRYFPEPDLPTIKVEREWVQMIKRTLPELPWDKKARFLTDYELGDYEADLLIQDKELANYFEGVAMASGDNKQAANWVINDVMREINERSLQAIDFPVSAENLAEIITLTSGKKINTPTARKIFTMLVAGDKRNPEKIVAEDGLGQVSDSGAIKEALLEAIAANPKAEEEVRSGKVQTAMWFVGQIMQKMKGKANPQSAGEVIAEHFGIDAAIFQQKKEKKKKKPNK